MNFWPTTVSFALSCNGSHFQVRGKCASELSSNYYYNSVLLNIPYKNTFEFNSNQIQDRKNQKKRTKTLWNSSNKCHTDAYVNLKCVQKPLRICKCLNMNLRNNNSVIKGSNWVKHIIRNIRPFWEIEVSFSVAAENVVKYYFQYSARANQKHTPTSCKQCSSNLLSQPHTHTNMLLPERGL